MRDFLWMVMVCGLLMFLYACVVRPQTPQPQAISAMSAMTGEPMPSETVLVEVEIVTFPDGSKIYRNIDTGPHFAQELIDGNWRWTVNVARGDQTPVVVWFEAPADMSGCVGDLNGDGVVNVSDLLILQGNWGPCE